MAWSPSVRRWEVYRKGAEPRFPQRFTEKEDALARALHLARLAGESWIEMREEDDRIRTIPVE